MKLFNLTTISFLVIFLLHCSLTEDNRNNDDSVTSAQINNSQVENLNKTDKQSLSERIKSIERAISKTSRDFDLRNLKDITLSKDDVEIRIWAELRYEIVNCLVLQKAKEKWNASLISVNVTDYGEYEKTKQNKISVNKRILPKPKSGWKNLNSFLIEKKIKLPLEYSLDLKTTMPVLEEGTVTLEIKEGDNYAVVNYKEFTDSFDGKSVVGVCNHLENEFKVKIGCGN